MEKIQSSPFLNIIQNFIKVITDLLYITIYITKLLVYVVNTENLNRCVFCNENINNHHNMLSGNVAFITKNGSYKLSNGIIVLTKSSLERFMSNSLNIS